MLRTTRSRARTGSRPFAAGVAVGRATVPARHERLRVLHLDLGGLQRRALPARLGHRDRGPAARRCRQPGPMQVVVLQTERINGASPGVPTVVCCQIVAASQVFTPPPNTPSNIPVNLPVNARCGDGDPGPVAERAAARRSRSSAPTPSSRCSTSGRTTHRSTRRSGSPPSTARPRSSSSPATPPATSCS